MASYALVTSGTCASSNRNQVTSVSDCDAAAAQLSLSDHDSDSWVHGGYPPNCWWDQQYSSLYLNSGSSTTSCSSSAQCVCGALISGAGGDPHISFANGGRADFRGSDRDSYAFVSSPGYHFAPWFQEVDFVFTAPTGVTRLVHGTFMTRAHWRVLTSAGDELLLSTDALRRGELYGTVSPRASLGGGGSNATRGESSRALLMKPWTTARFGDVRLTTRMLTVSVESPMWQINVTSKPIYGLAMPNTSEHRNGVGEWDVVLLAKDELKRRLWDAEQRRLDIEIQGAFPQPQAHGILGQSYRDSTVRSGKLDNYGAIDTPELIQSDGTGPEMWTTAQAEGAIDGVYTDYRLSDPFSTEFGFSRYHRPRSSMSIPPLGKRRAATSDTRLMRGQ